MGATPTSRQPRQASQDSKTLQCSQNHPPPESRLQAQSHTSSQPLSQHESGQTLEPAHLYQGAANVTHTPFPARFTHPRHPPPLPTSRSTFTKRLRERLEKRLHQQDTEENARPSPNRSPFENARGMHPPGLEVQSRAETDEDTYRDILRPVPPGISANGLDTPRRSEWSEDSDDEERSLRYASRLYKTSEALRRKRRWWAIGAVISVFFVTALSLGLTLGLKERSNSHAEEQRVGLSTVLTDTKSLVGLAAWGWSDGGFSLFEEECGSVRMMTGQGRSASPSTTTTTVSLQSGLKSSWIRLAVNQIESEGSLVRTQDLVKCDAHADACEVDPFLHQRRRQRTLICHGDASISINRSPS